MTSLRVLALTRYDSLGASSRVRMFQYLPALHELGVEVTVSPLLDNAYVQALYRGEGMGPVYLARRYRQRVRELARARAFDVLWVEKELLPYLPAFMEERLAPHGVRRVVDYDDAVFVRYQDHGNPLVRAALGGKIAGVMRAADSVVAGNAWLAAYARDAGCRRVYQVPSVIDLQRYRVRPAAGTTRRELGWIGSPATAHYLDLLRAPLKRLAARRPVRLVCIGAPAPEIDGVDSESVPWTEETEVAAVGALDVGLMPLLPGRWEQGKCGFKLIQYMACGIPAVASAVGANRDIIRHGEDGFLAATDDEWVNSLARLLEDDALYTAMAMAARRKVEAEYSVQGRVGELAAILRGEA